jgi:hypothetical protein
LSEAEFKEVVILPVKHLKDNPALDILRKFGNANGKLVSI